MTFFEAKREEDVVLFYRYGLRIDASREGWVWIKEVNVGTYTTHDVFETTPDNIDDLRPQIVDGFLAWWRTMDDRDWQSPRP